MRKIGQKIVEAFKYVGIVFLSVLSALWVADRSNNARFTYNEVQVDKVQEFKEPKEKRR